MAGGYDLDRFVYHVDEDFRCVICRDVLRDARLCKAGEHHFCFNCISQYLDNASTCPVCRQHLSPETLQRPQRFLRNRLSELRIKCDYINRGCPEHVELGNLPNHENGCQYRPILCENCRMHVSAREMQIHQANFCGVDLQRLQMLRNDVEEIGQRVTTIEGDLQEMRQDQNIIKEKVNRIKSNQH